VTSQAVGSAPTPGYYRALAHGAALPQPQPGGSSGLLSASLRAEGARRPSALRASTGSGFSAWPSTPTVVGSAPATMAPHAIYGSSPTGRSKTPGAAALGVNKKPLGKPMPVRLRAASAAAAPALPPRPALGSVHARPTDLHVVWPDPLLHF
jgi:hypothetical protein